MKTTVLLFLLFSLCCFIYRASGTGEITIEVTRNITKNLILSNGLEYGKWGLIEFCQDGSYAMDFEVMFEEYTLSHIDETAINAVRLYCFTPGGGHTGYITSTIGTLGKWQGLRACPNGLMTGMRARVLAYQGLTFDDVAVQNVEMQCNYGESKVTGVDEGSEDNKIKDGDWSAWGQCDKGSAICGIEIRYEKTNLVEDTTAVCNISMFCCTVEE